LKDQGRNVQAETVGVNLDNSLNRFTQMYKIQAYQLDNQETRANLADNRAFQPLRRALVKHQIEAQKLTNFTDGHSLVTDPQGNQWFMAFDHKTNSITPTLFARANDNMPEQMRMFNLGLQLTNLMEGDDRDEAVAALITQYRIMSLGNDTDSGVAEGENILDPSIAETSPSEGKKKKEIPPTIKVDEETEARISKKAQVKSFVKRGLITEEDRKLWNGGKRPVNSLRPGRPGYDDARKRQEKWDRIDGDITEYIAAGDE